MDAVSACVAGGLDSGVPPDGGAPVDSGPPLAPTDQLDLLFMIDNSTSTNEAQFSLVTEIPRLVTAITTGDRDGDGTADFMPVRSLHIAIVDSDMGIGDVTGIATCDPGFGDDGLMQFRTRAPRTGCSADYTSAYSATPNVFELTAGGARTAAQVATDVACVAFVGTGGCGFEFELESPLKALSLAPTASGDSPVTWTRAGYRPPTFWQGTLGHGNDPATNGAFLRPDSVLAIVTVNDEDDCSTPNPHIFSPDDPTYDFVDLNLRCHTFTSELYPIQRYADGFLGLRASPARLVYVPIVGVPPALAGMSPTVILADPNMQEQTNPAMPNQLLPACVLAGGGGVAYPGVRMTQLAQLLAAAGAHTSVQSICNANLSTATDSLLGVLADALPR
jgi:hypothetical protein